MKGCDGGGWYSHVLGRDALWGVKNDQSIIEWHTLWTASDL